MKATNKVTVNFVTRRPDGACVLHLVEEGPWDSAAIERNLKRVQERLYNCVDALLDGVVAEQFPESIGQVGVIQLGCYDLPSEKVQSFFDRFTSFINESQEYQDDVSKSPHISDLEFNINHGSLDKRTEQSPHDNSYPVLSSFDHWQHKPSTRSRKCALGQGCMAFDV